MGISVIGGAGAAGSSLPINALEKVYEAYSEDGYFEYSPVGGVPAGKYILEVEGSNVDYIEAVGKGQASKGKSGRCYLDVLDGGAITATASAFGDSTVAATVSRLSTPHFTTEKSPGNGTYSFNPGNRANIADDGNIVSFFGTDSNKRLETSSNGITFTWQKEFYNNNPSEGWAVATGNNNLANHQFTSDVKKIGDYWYAIAGPVNNSVGMIRSADPKGAAGTWTTLGNNSFAGWSLAGSPTSNRIFRGYNGIYYSDNFGASWTSANNHTSSYAYDIQSSGSDLYAIQSNRYYSGNVNSYISVSTNNGLTWTQRYNFGTPYFPLSIANKPGTSEWVAILIDGNSYTYTAFSDDNCASWSIATYNTGTSYSNYQKVIWSEIANGFLFAASENNSGNIRYSATGANGTWSLWRAVPGNALIDLVENGGKVLYSAYNALGVFWTSDGVTFNESGSDFSNIRGIAYAGGNYFIGNGTSTILKGPDFDQLAKISIGQSVASMVASGDRILGKISNGSNYAYSIDAGLTWSAGVTNGMYGAPCFTDGTFFRIDTSYNLWSSVDLVSWTQRTSFPTSYRFIRKLGSMYFAYGGASNNNGYGLSKDLTSWTYHGLNSSYQSAWGAGLDEASGWHFFHFGNGSSMCSYNPFAGNVWASSLYGINLEGPAYTDGNSAMNSTSYRFDGVEAGGVGWLYQGFTKAGQSYRTSGMDTLRYYKATDGVVVAPYHTTYLNQPAVGFGKVTSVDIVSNNVYQMSYGKPASIAIYKMKEEA